MRRADPITPHGQCAVVELAADELDAALAALPDAERTRAAQLSPARRSAFVAGRTALHVLIGMTTPVEIGDRGGPIVAGWTCSIAHKTGPSGTRAAALAAPAGAGFVGVDLERAQPPRIDIGRRILTPREPRAIGAELLRVFAIKEAIYKAIDPIVRRYVTFAEVEIAADGTVSTPLPVAIQAWATQLDGYWLATATGTVSTKATYRA